MNCELKQIPGAFVKEDFRDFYCLSHLAGICDRADQQRYNTKVTTSPIISILSTLLVRLFKSDKMLIAFPFRTYTL